jgi:hypothetical protein
MKRRSSRKSMRGRGFMDFLKSAGSFISKSKLISTIGSALGAAGVPFAGAIGSAAGLSASVSIAAGGTDSATGEAYLLRGLALTGEACAGLAVARLLQGRKH